MSSVTFLANQNMCRVDMMLTLFVLLAVYGGVFSHTAKGQMGAVLGFVLCTIGIAGGLLTKGILGAVLPLSILGSTLFFSDIYYKRISYKRYLFLFFALLLGVIPLLYWYLLVYRCGGYSAFYEAFFVNNFGRFSGSQGDHTGSAIYYLKRLPEIFAPYFIFTLFATVMLIRQFFKRPRGTVSERDIFLLCAFIVPFLMFNISSAKRLVYLLPLAPFVALLAAIGVKQLISFLPRRYSYGFYRTIYGRLNIIIMGLCFIGLVIHCALFLTSRYIYYEKSAEMAFMKCATFEEQGKEIILIDAHERTRGAAVFYLKHNVKERKHTEADPQSPCEIWVVRAPSKPVGIKFPAKLYLLVTKAQKRDYLKLAAEEKSTGDDEK